MTKRRIVALFLSILLALSTVAYADTAAAEAAKNPVTITVWSNDAHSKDLFVEKVDNFNNNEGKELGIVIELSVYGTDYYSTLDVALQADEAPYIFKCNKIPQYARAGKLVALEDLPGGAEVAAPYAEMNSNGVGIVDGKTYAVPFKSTTMALAYNKELFASLNLEFPTTWEEMRECARIITENGNGLKYGYGLGMSYVSYPLFFILPMASASTGIMHFDHGAGRYNFSALAPYMKHMLDIINDGSIFPGYETMDDDTKRAQFAAGNIGMIPVFSSDVGVLTKQFPATFEWGVGPYPTETEDVRYKMQSNPSTFYVINQSAVKDGVQEKVITVMNALLSEEHLLTLFEGEKDMISRADVKAKSTAANVSTQWKEFGESSYRYTGYGVPDGLLTIEGDTYKDTFDKILTGLVDPTVALADLDTRYNAALDKAIADGTLSIDDYIVKGFEDIVAYSK